MKVGIALDNWKLPIFERHLKQGGYTFARADGLTEGAMILTVNTDNVTALAVVIQAANDEAAGAGSLQ